MTCDKRRQQIEAMLADEPQDVFLRYSLAMEMFKAEEHPAGLALLQELMNESPPMLGAFSLAGQQLTRLKRFAEACEAYRRGIEQARLQGDAHAADSMNDHLTRLEDLL